MRKSELLRALQREIRRHNLSTFMNEEMNVVEVGCSACKKRYGTKEKFIQHLCDDVLPPLLDKLSKTKTEYEKAEE